MKNQILLSLSMLIILTLTMHGSRTASNPPVPTPEPTPPDLLIGAELVPCFGPLKGTVNGLSGDSTYPTLSGGILEKDHHFSYTDMLGEPYGNGNACGETNTSVCTITQTITDSNPSGSETFVNVVNGNHPHVSASGIELLPCLITSRFPAPDDILHCLGHKSDPNKYLIGWRDRYLFEWIDRNWARKSSFFPLDVTVDIHIEQDLWMFDQDSVFGNNVYDGQISFTISQIGNGFIAQ